MTTLFIVLGIIGAYLVGSISSAVVVCHLMGLPDPRTSGSRNPGTTNVLRLGGKRAAIITLLGDVLKGFVPVFIAHFLIDSPVVLAAAGLAAFFGHVFPVLFRFQGGKGVATAFGAIVGISWPAALAILATWLSVAVIFRYSSLAALVAALLAPVCMAYLVSEAVYVGAVSLIALVIIWRHRANIRNLLAGTETKIGQKSL
uniref:Glycerol-3-phosphate acyltransferase n=1 Tax=Candidatus Kentrum sp. FM TaxID=2126340 RepID=A0A450SB41_9GAMM|nr:MAG: glycerol-3-phosphate acyltransferase PlsY [Candidatus Kentron sp. FM]VFJ49643.1 MAG: glycerol-3-phosphate acyltransferase PlsY [Candidatus Kentron sp. FM]VFK18218.1 MAG: glycerol-3-phosphate acyltransferase PlsY [Candidatus Kentron sp. FM]